MISTKKISVKETYAIRLKVLRDGIALPYQFQEDLDTDTFHVGAFLIGNLVGVSSFMKNSHVLFADKNQYQLRGMAILPEARGKGCGKELIDFTVQSLQHKDVSILWCNAREVAVNFYEKRGFSIIGNPFIIPQIGMHYIMYKKL